MKTILGIGSVILGVSGGALAQDTAAHHQALVAGYKAHFTCSAFFNGGKNLDQIAAHELARIYPSYRETLAALPNAVVDSAAKTVSVRYSDRMPPRISAWRPHLGCSQLPIGATAELVDSLPKIDVKTPEMSAAAWPLGDAVSAVKPSAKLQAVLDKAFDQKSYGDGNFTSAILISSPQVVLAERYIDGYTPHTAQRTWSVAKSISASLIGIAVHKGIMKVDDPAAIPEWSNAADPRRAITNANLLHMASGLYSGKSGSRTDQLYAGGSLVTDRSTESPLDAMPGTRWRYANNDTLLAIRSLRANIGDDQRYLSFPYTELLHKIGMHHTFMETDWEGNFIGSSQVWTTSRDLARLGILYLNKGQWQGEQIFGESWADYVATPAPIQPDFALQDKGPGYGAQFWLPVPSFKVPMDAYRAAGHRGQHLVIIPSKNLVIVRRGYDESGGVGFDINAFTRDVLKALE